MLLHPLYWAGVQPDKPAYVMAQSGAVISYSTLRENICRGAQLLHKLGLKCGDGLALLSENQADFLTIYWAAQVSGLYFTPISTQFQNREIEYLLNDCDASVLVVSEAQHDKITSDHIPQAHILTCTQWQQACRGLPAYLPEYASEGAEMLYSSGSTGSPKGVCNTTPGASLGTVSDVFQKRLKLHQIDQNTVYLSPAPMYHSAPLRYNQMVHRVGGTSIIMEKFDAETALSLIEKYRELREENVKLKGALSAHQALRVKHAQIRKLLKHFSAGDSVCVQ